MKDFYNLCELFKKAYSSENGKVSVDSNDNYNITIQPLYCDGDLSMEDNDLFMQKCADDSLDSYQPVVNVMNSFSYFNVTGNLEIIDVNFTGVNALSFPKTVQQLPLRLCEIKDQMSLTSFNYKQTVIQIETAQQPQNSYFNSFWTCKDSYYSGSTTPYQNLNNDLRCKEAQNRDYQMPQSTLNCPGTPLHPNFFRADSDDANFINGYPWRKQTLFNIYSLGTESSRKIVQSAPRLTLEKCSLKHFYGGYESLINIETDNMSRFTRNYTQVKNSTYQNVTYIALSGMDLGVSLIIRNSQFQFSRFCRGMIFYRKFNPLLSPFSTFLNLTQPPPSSQLNTKSDPFIYIYTSSLQMLNSFTNLTALQPLDQSPVSLSNSNISYRMPQHRGIVMNLEDFPGRIEIVSTQVTHNAHFLPELSFKYQPDEAMGVGLGIEKGMPKFMQGLDGGLQEVRMGTCSDNQKDIRFMETVLRQSEDVEELYDLFERISVIYISRPRNSVLFDSNIFSRNIGMFGGAITINSPDLSSSNFPAIVFKNNYFEHNMAYLSGNSIYVRFVKNQDESNCGGVLSTQNYHYQQAGLKIHNGGGATYICRNIFPEHSDYLTLTKIPYQAKLGLDFQVDIQRIKPEDTDQELINYSKPFQLVFDGDQFEDCNSGQRGSALQIRNFTKIIIQKTIFTLNGPVYAPYIEKQYSPYYLHFAENLVTFSDSECRDEYEYLEICLPKYPQRPNILFSRTQGALYIEFCMTVQCQQQANQTLTIEDTFFTTNDAGSLLDREYSNFEFKTASCIYIIGGNQVIMRKSTFSQNQGRFLTQYFLTINTKVSYLSTSYFPPQYFFHAHSPIINWITVREKQYDSKIKLPYQMSLTVDNCVFSQNKNMQTFRLPGEIYRQKYYGQLISVRNQENNTLNAEIRLNILNCSVSDNFFSGVDSSLFYAENTILMIQGNSFINNGYLMDNLEFIKNKFTGEQGYITEIYNHSNGKNLFPQQQHGIFYLNNSNYVKQDISSELFRFRDNKVSFLFSQNGIGTILALDQDALFQGNMYQYVFTTNKGALLTFNSTNETFTNIIFQNESYYNIYSKEGSLFNLISQGSNGIFTVLFLDCTFKNIKANTQSPLTFGSNTRKVIMNNTNFTSDITYMQPNLIQNKFTKLKYVLSYFINQTLFKSSVIDVSHQNGLIHIQEKPFSAYIPTMFEGKIIQSVQKIDNSMASIIISGCNFENIVQNFMQNSVIFYEPQNQEPLQMSKIRIFNISVVSSGIIGLRDNTYFEGSEILFQQCFSYYKSAGIMVGSQSKVNLKHAIFRNLTATTASAIFMMPQSVVNCIQCSFLGNFANESGVIQSSLESKLVIDSSQFIQNRASSNSLLTFIQSTIYFKNVTMIDNKCPGISNIAIVIGGDAFFENLSVSNSGRILPLIVPLIGFIQGQMMAKITIQNSSFTKLSATQAVILNLEGLSKGIIKNCTIQNNIGQTIINAENSQYLSIDQSIFNSNKVSDEVKTELTTAVYIYNTIFFQGQGRYVNTLKGIIDITNCVFQDGDPILESGGKGLLATNVETLSLKFCRFNNLNSSDNGGAVAVLSTQLIANQNHTISKNEFIDNFSIKGQGGALLVQNQINTTLLGNKFLTNSAFRGGALFFSCTAMRKNEIQNKQCQMQISQGNNFRQNSAKEQGGAIYWDNFSPNIDQSTKFEDNLAPYNPDIAAFPKSVWLEFLSNNDYYDPYNTKSFLMQLKTFPRAGEKIEVFGLIPTIVSGVPFQFLVFIIDHFDNLYAPVIENFKAEIKLEKKDMQSSIINNVAEFDRGVFNFSNTIIKTTPGSRVPLTIQFQGYLGSTNLFSELSQNLVLTVRRCVYGEELTGNLQCRTCQDGTYFKNGTVNETSQCQKCPDNSLCFGGTMLVPARGNFRTYLDNQTIKTCPNRLACLGGDQKNMMGICALGYQGNMCAECQKGFYQLTNFQCQICPLKSTILKRLIISIILASLILFAIIMTSINTGPQIKPTLLSSIKIMVNHQHMIMILGMVNYNWTSLVKSFQKSYIQIASSSKFIFSLQCLFDQDNGYGYYYNLLMYLCAFPIMALTAFLLYALFTICPNRRKFMHNIHQLITAMLVFGYMLHPIISIGAFESLSCADVGGKEMRLRAFARALCFKGDHMKYVLNYTIPTIVLWVIGAPLLILWLNGRQLILLQEIESSEVQEIILKDLIEHKNRYGFIIAGFQHKWLYWEFLIIVRKVLMIFLATFLQNYSVEVQSITLLIVLTVSVLLHQRYQPYHTPFLNTLESSSLLGQMIFLFLGLFFQQSNHYSQNDGLSMGEKSENLMFAILLTSQLQFFLIWIYHFRQELIKVLIQPVIFQDGQTQQLSQLGLIRKIVLSFVACKTPQKYLINNGPLSQLIIPQYKAIVRNQQNVCQESVEVKQPALIPVDINLKPSQKLISFQQNSKRTLQEQTDYSDRHQSQYQGVFPSQSSLQSNSKHHKTKLKYQQNQPMRDLSQIQSQEQALFQSDFSQIQPRNEDNDEIAEEIQQKSSRKKRKRISKIKESQDEEEHSQRSFGPKRKQK